MSSVLFHAQAIRRARGQEKQKAERDALAAKNTEEGTEVTSFEEEASVKFVSIPQVTKGKFRKASEGSKELSKFVRHPDSKSVMKKYFGRERQLHVDYNILLHGTGILGLIFYLYLFRSVFHNHNLQKNQHLNQN